MSQQQLNGADVGALFEEVDGEGVAPIYHARQAPLFRLPDYYRVVRVWCPVSAAQEHAYASAAVAASFKSSSCTRSYCRSFRTGSSFRCGS
jgi:hypothetical protein